MKKTLLTTLLLSAMIFSAGAEKIIFSNAPAGYKEANISGTATIDASTGDITVTAGNHWIVGEQAGSVAFYPNKSYVENDTESLTFHWTLNFVENCTTNSNWSFSGVTSPSANGEHQKVVAIGAVGSGKTFSISCDPIGGGSAITKSFTINKVDGSGGGTPAAPVINTFAATPGSLPAGGGSTRLTWTSTNATHCRGSWSPTNNLSANNSTGVLVSLTATTTYTLTCYNGSGDSIQRTVRVSVGGGSTGIPSWCPSAPAGKINKHQNTTLSQLTLNHGTNDHPLVRPVVSRGNFELSSTEYSALKFTTPTGRPYGGIVFENPPANQTTGTYRVTISECPGDLGTRLPPNGACSKTMSAGSIYWSNQANPFSAQCKLDAGKTYYLNIMHATCPLSKCGVLFGIN